METRKKTSQYTKLGPNAKKNCEPWKRGNPKAGFPLFHRPESPAAQGKERPFTQTA
jgi:hypothetical protein